MLTNNREVFDFQLNKAPGGHLHFSDENLNVKKRIFKQLIIYPFYDYSSYHRGFLVFYIFS